MPLKAISVCTSFRMIWREHNGSEVELIYAEIKQDSRTTINDELKLWKDKQAKADALTAALPPAVASAMLNVWALAVEHGKSVRSSPGRG